MTDPLAPAPTAQDLLARGFVRACAVAEVPAMMPRRVAVGGYGLLICRYRMRFLAVDELCPHKHKSMMHGLIMGGELICPHHQYRFELATGRCLSHRCAAVPTYEAAVADGDVFVRLPAPSPPADLNA